MHDLSTDVKIVNTMTGASFTDNVYKGFYENNSCNEIGQLLIYACRGGWEVRYHIAD
jgi:hypothetical protein